MNIGAGNAGGFDNPIKQPPTMANTDIITTKIVTQITCVTFVVVFVIFDVKPFDVVDSY